jgi:hypothetical protein
MNSPSRSAARITARFIRAGDEQAWWKAAGIDPIKVARQLRQQTRLNHPQHPHHPHLAGRPQTRSIASAPDDTTESRSDQDP